MQTSLLKVKNYSISWHIAKINNVSSVAGDTIAPCALPQKCNTVYIKQWYVPANVKTKMPIVPYYMSPNGFVYIMYTIMPD
jgi:hypothetical protein